MRIEYILDMVSASKDPKVYRLFVSKDIRGTDGCCRELYTVKNLNSFEAQDCMLSSLEGLTSHELFKPNGSNVNSRFYPYLAFFRLTPIVSLKCVEQS